MILILLVLSVIFLLGGIIPYDFYTETLLTILSLFFILLPLFVWPVDYGYIIIFLFTIDIYFFFTTDDDDVVALATTSDDDWGVEMFR